MRRWSEVAEHLAATTRTSEKTRLLADYLRPLSPAELPIAAVFFAGKPFAQQDGRTTGLGWATIAQAVTQLAGTTAGALSEAYDRSSDLGIAVAAVLGRSTGPGTVPRTTGPAPIEPSADAPSLLDVAAAYAAIEQAAGPVAKGALFARLLARCDPMTAKYVVKVLTGDLRIGLREGLLEAAVAEAFDQPLSAVQRAGMLTGDVGATALLARDDELATAALRLFQPLRFMLASPAEDAAEILQRLGPVVWVEDKYDGIRAQLHRVGDRVRLYSRDLHDVSGQFPEVVAGATGLSWDGILDGELLAYRDGAVLPFVALQRRLGRKAPSVAIQAEVPVIFVAFDVLALASAAEGPVRPRVLLPQLDRPLAERRQLLEALQLPLIGQDGLFGLSHLVSVDSIESLEQAYAAARARNNEGLMVKDPASPYSPGRRGLGWLKMKRALATIECVVTGVEGGHGKRHGVLSDYTFAVRDETSGTLVTIGKAYSGLTDAEIAEMTGWFEAHTVAQYGRYRTVEPTVVVEVAFDVIVRSNRHRSGFSLRFPRIVRLRPDKTPDEIDSVATVEAIWRGRQHGPEHLVTARAGNALEG